MTAKLDEPDYINNNSATYIEQVKIRIKDSVDSHNIPKEVASRKSKKIDEYCIECTTKRQPPLLDEVN